jgi:predicted dehydrogenase
MIRWGIIGCGDVARRRVAQAIQQDPHSSLIAACRRNEFELQQFCRDFDVPRQYTDAVPLTHDSDIDAVYIATPVRQHCPQTVAAAEKGKHVLVEKPMAMSVVECDGMIAACRAAGVVLGVAYYRRFYPVVARIKQLIEDGQIGQPLSVSAVTGIPFAMTSEDDGYWRVIPERGGGGALMDIGSHRLNLFLDLFGPVVEVRTLCDTLHASYAAENTATLALRFESGVHGTLQCFFGVDADPDEFTIIGTKGRLASAPLNGGDLTIHTEDGRRTESHPPWDNFNAPLITDFTAAILENRPPRVTGEEGRATNALLQRAYAAA